MEENKKKKEDWREGDGKRGKRGNVKRGREQERKGGRPVREECRKMKKKREGT